MEAKNQLIDFVGLSKRYFCQKWLKIQIGEGIDGKDSERYQTAVPVVSLPTEDGRDRLKASRGQCVHPAASRPIFSLIPATKAIQG